MIIPKIGDWVECFDRYDGPGKVEEVDLGKKMLKAFFLDESGYEQGGGGEDIWEFFKNIEKIITDPDRIEELEKEAQGMLKT